MIYWSAISLHILEVPGSKAVPKTDHSENFRTVPQSLQKNSGTEFQIGQAHPFHTHSEFIILLIKVTQTEILTTLLNELHTHTHKHTHTQIIHRRRKA